MTREQLCALALQAIDGSGAWEVLADAIEESGWDDPLMFRWWTRVPDEQWFLNDEDLERDWRREYSRQVVAVLLFGSWPTRWELAERCQKSAMQVMFDRMYEAAVAAHEPNR